MNKKKLTTSQLRRLAIEQLRTVIGGTEIAVRAYDPANKKEIVGQ